MSCDIHVYAETRHINESGHAVWVNRDQWEADDDVLLFPSEFGADGSTQSAYYRKVHEASIYKTRDYQLFGILAGVRGGHFPSISPPKGIPSDLSYQTMGDVLRWGTGGHSHSYLTLEELEAYSWDGHRYEWKRTVDWREVEDIRAHPEHFCNPAINKAADGDYTLTQSETPREASPAFQETLEKLRELAHHHGVGPDSVRLVFFFDN